MSHCELCQIARRLRERNSVLPDRNFDVRPASQTSQFIEAVIEVVSTYICKITVPELLQTLGCEPPGAGVVSFRSRSHGPMILRAQRDRFVVFFFRFFRCRRIGCQRASEIFLQPQAIPQLDPGFDRKPAIKVERRGILYRLEESRASVGVLFEVGGVQVLDARPKDSRRISTGGAKMLSAIAALLWATSVAPAFVGLNC